MLDHRSIDSLLPQVNHNLIISERVPLADKNNFGTGGPARFYCRPTTADQFAQALRYADENKLDVFVLGGGANILISDEGFPGLVIHPALTTIVVGDDHDRSDHVFVTAGAGVTIESLIAYCLEHQIIGLEEFSGIPGTVGGAVYINIHYYEFLLEQFLVSATLLCKKTYQTLTVDAAWFQFGYDQSKLQDKEYFVVNATFCLHKTDAMTAVYAQGRSAEITRHRRKRYPYQYTCGSFFRNFHPNEVAHTDKKLIYVAYYLDQLGVKGQLAVGGAIVSYQHANMIVCERGTSTDIITLTRTMQQMVYQAYGMKPQPECQLVGFAFNPFDDQ